MRKENKKHDNDVAVDAHGSQVKDDQAGLSNSKQEVEEANAHKESDLLFEIKSLKEDKLRLLAELENTRKRFVREKDEAIKFAVHKFATDLLEVYDDMTRALHAFNNAELSKEMRDLVEGVKLIMRSLDSMFAKHNIVKIDSLGCEFDQNVHQALFTADNTQYLDAKDGEIVAVIKEGFMLNGRLLRSASVGVVRK